MPRHLSEADKMRAIVNLENGWSYSAVAQQLNASKSCIGKIKRKWEAERTVKRRHGSGRPRISTPAQDENTIDYLRRHPFDTAVKAKDETDFPGNVRTVLRRIRESEIRNFTAVNKYALSPRHMEMRMEFARRYVNEPIQFWESVVFSDEKIYKSFHDGRLKVYRPRNSRFTQDYVRPVAKSGNFSIHTWGWINADGLGVLWLAEDRFNGLVYRDILENIMLPSVRHVYPEHFIFQHVSCKRVK